MTTSQILWGRVTRFLEEEGHKFKKMYRIEVTPNEVVVWHDQYDSSGKPIMDKDRNMPVVKKTRIL